MKYLINLKPIKGETRPREIYFSLDAVAEHISERIPETVTQVTRLLKKQKLLFLNWGETGRDFISEQSTRVAIGHYERKYKRLNVNLSELNTLCHRLEAHSEHGFENIRAEITNFK